MTQGVDRNGRSGRRRGAGRSLRRLRRRISGRIVALALLGVVLVGVAVFGYQAYRATDALRDAANQAEALQEQIINGEDGSRRTLDALRESTAAAERHTDGILWTIGTKVPLLGKSATAVRTVSDVMDQVARDALPPLVDVADQVSVNAFSPQDGKIQLSTVVAIAPAVADADVALTAASAALADLEPDGLLLPLRVPVGTIKDKVDAARSAASSAGLAARLLPTMLGGDGTRRYLLLVQNNAEIRATGGIPGSYAVITASKGRISMGEQGSIQDLPAFGDPVLPMTEDEKTVFTEQLVTDLRDTTVTPDFPRTGEIARAMARKGLGVDVDGVMSVDPVAMSYLLAGTGPVTLDNKAVLDQSNAVDVLLSQVYLVFNDGEIQDQFFEGAARKIFDVVRSGSGESRIVIAGMVRAASENRLMVWSRHEDEQAQIETTGLSGAFAGDTGPVPHVGLYFGDAAATKMEYYFDFRTTATSTRCLENGRQEIKLSAQLTSNAPTDLPKQITGPYGTIPAGDMSLVAWIYAPFGGLITDIRLDDEDQPVTTARLDGRRETSVGVDLQPGKTRLLTATMITGPGQVADGVLSTTPGVQTTRNDQVIGSSCG